MYDELSCVSGASKQQYSLTICTFHAWYDDWILNLEILATLWNSCSSASSPAYFSGLSAVLACLVAVFKSPTLQTVALSINSQEVRAIDVTSPACCSFGSNVCRLVDLISEAGHGSENNPTPIPQRQVNILQILLQPTAASEQPYLRPMRCRAEIPVEA